MVDDSRQVIADPGIDVSFANENAVNERKLGLPINVDGALSAMIMPAPGSSCDKFVFAIYRDGNPVYKSSTMDSIAGSHILMQAKDGDGPGLLPGLVQLYVWGVTASGDVTAPTVVSFSINGGQTSSTTK